ncbi:MAG: ABC transporter transmembrane domain-containing protein [Pseudomonadota bacterium]
MTPPAILGTAARQRMLARLVGVGLLQAALAAAGAVALGRFLAAPDMGAGILPLLIAGGSGIAALFLHAHGRALAERFGQAYVAVCRVRLLKAIVRAGGDRGSHGITMTRLISDLSSIKNWVSLGIAAGTTGLATLLGLMLAAALLHPSAVPGLLIVTLTTALAAAAAYRPLRRAVRDARAARGRMAGRVGEAVLGAPRLRAYARLDDERRVLYRLAERMAGLLALRYWWASLLRHAPETGFVAALAYLAVSAGGEGGGIAAIAPALVFVGSAGVALRDLTRTLDLWLNFREGRRRLAEALSRAGPAAVTWSGTGPLGLDATALALGPEGPLVDLRVAPGERVALRAEPGARAFVNLVAGLTVPEEGRLSLVAEDGTAWRSHRIAGAAIPVAPSCPLGRGTIGAQLTALAKDWEEAERAEVLRRAAISPADLDRNAGQAAPALAARARLAAAVFARPGLLIIDDPVFELDDLARQALAETLAEVRATVLVLRHGDAPALPVDRTIALGSPSGAEAPTLAVVG